jgi:hypothetical protein
MLLLWLALYLGPTAWPISPLHAYGIVAELALETVILWAWAIIGTYRLLYRS